ncbi:hypothetical protein [Candidatus Palauibacter sp.]|uniref:hypothetical protein n=1 Tax=Candidatus Palauibacter sp. TaxID=3101350 RepID=UPI003B02835D
MPRPTRAEAYHDNDHRRDAPAENPEPNTGKSRPALADASTAAPTIPGTQATPDVVAFLQGIAQTRVGDPQDKAHLCALANCAVTTTYTDAGIATFEATYDELAEVLEHTRTKTLWHRNSRLKRRGLLAWTRTGRRNKWTLFTGPAALRLIPSPPQDDRAESARSDRAESARSATAHHCGGTPPPSDPLPPTRPRRIRRLPTQRQLRFAADLGVDPDGLDRAALGEAIETAQTNRAPESRQPAAPRQSRRSRRRADAPSWLADEDREFYLEVCRKNGRQPTRDEWRRVRENVRS